MRVRLTRKLSDRIDGVDLKAHAVGDVIDLPALHGHLLLAEEWAILERREKDLPVGVDRRGREPQRRPRPS